MSNVLEDLRECAAAVSGVGAIHRRARSFIAQRDATGVVAAALPVGRWSSLDGMREQLHSDKTC